MHAASGGYDPLQTVLDAITAHGCHVKPAGRDRYQAQCPAHDDRDPSLSIARGTSGEAKVVLHCHAGCSIGDILDTLGLPPAALYNDYQPTGATIHHLHHIRAWNPDGTPPARPRPKPWKRRQDARYTYLWPDGTPAIRVTRWAKLDPDTGETMGKTFTQARWDNGGWVNGLDGLDAPLYHADQITAAIRTGQPILVCEGEKDADTAHQEWGGMTATCNPMGAGSWRPHHTEALRGANVFIVADDDDPGRDHAAHVAAQLEGVAASIAVYLPTAGGDLADHITNGGTFADLAPLDPVEDARRRTRRDLPTIDWHHLWADDSEEEWILEPILPARRLVALYSAPKIGKSLLMLEIAVGISRGTETLGVTPPRPYTVLYVDFENDPKGDIRTRLQAMGHGPDDLANLHYLSFPTLEALDSQKGAAQLLAAVDAYHAEVVVIDTVSRAVAGDENDNDTWLAFYRNTGLALKQAKVALIRLDHAGKDETKGQRGGSAKSGDVDAVWRMSKITDTVLRLDCEAARIPIVEKTLTLHRETAPRLRHRVDPAGAAAIGKVQVDDIVAWLDANDYPTDVTVSDAADAYRESGRKARQELISRAVKQRKERVPPWDAD